MADGGARWQRRGLMIAILCRAFSALPAQGAEPTRQQDAVPQKDEYFDIAEFRVLGNSVLPVKSMERAVYPFAGPHKSIQDVQAARGALESAYHEAGYATVFVDIPEQDVSEESCACGPPRGTSTGFASAASAISPLARYWRGCRKSKPAQCPGCLRCKRNWQPWARRARIAL